MGTCWKAFCVDFKTTRYFSPQTLIQVRNSIFVNSVSMVNNITKRGWSYIMLLTLSQVYKAYSKKRDGAVRASPFQYLTLHVS